MRFYFLLLALLTSVTSALAELRTNIEYGRVGDEALLLDVNIPDGEALHPVAILVHGGGWSSGDKSGSNKPGDGADITPWFAPLTEAHFAWFSINYRMAPAHRWPACFDDVQTAIRWVKLHAREYHGDPTRIALFGHSAGGHLVCLAATQAKDDTRVQAVVGCAPVTDFEQDLAKRGGLSTSLQNLLDRPKEVTPDALSILRDLSPVNHVKAGLPPFLLIQGEADKTVPLQQTLQFQEKLQAAHVPCGLIVIPGAPHSMIAWDKIDTSYKARMISWLERTLSAGSGVR